MSELGLSTSPAPNRRLPRPPPAAPAAGGRGNPDSRRVHSVGELRASSRRRQGGGGAAGLVLQVVDFPVDGGAPRSSGVSPLPSSSWRFRGAAGLDFPSPESVAGRRIWPLLKVSWKKQMWFGSSTTKAFSGVGPTTRKSLIGRLIFCGAPLIGAPQNYFLWRTKPGAPQKVTFLWRTKPHAPQKFEILRRTKNKCATEI